MRWPTLDADTKLTVRLPWRSRGNRHAWDDGELDVRRFALVTTCKHCGATHVEALPRFDGSQGPLPAYGCSVLPIPAEPVAEPDGALPVVAGE